MSDPFKAGDTVVFKGYADEDDMPENGDLLVEGEEYKVLDYVEPEDPEDGDPTYVLEVLDDDGEAVEVEIFTDEVTAPKAKPKAKAKAKAPAKAKSKAKAPAKKKAAKAKSTDEEEEDNSESGTRQEEIDPELKGIIRLSEDQEDPEILEAVNSAEDLIELAGELAQESANTEWRLGGILYHVRIGKDYQQLDERYAEKGGFRLFCAEVLKTDYRKAMDLVNIYTRFSAVGLGAEDLQEMGWSKAALIQSSLTEETADELVESANESTVVELKETIKETKAANTGKATKTVVKMTRFTYAIPEKDGKDVAGMLEMAREATDIQNDGELFAHIVRGWAEDNLDLSQLAKVKRSQTAAANKKAAAKEKAPAKKAAAKAKAKPKAKSKAKPKAKAKAKAPARKKAG